MTFPGHERVVEAAERLAGMPLSSGRPRRGCRSKNAALVRTARSGHRSPTPSNEAFKSRRATSRRQGIYDALDLSTGRFDSITMRSARVGSERTAIVFLPGIAVLSLGVRNAVRASGSLPAAGRTAFGCWPYWRLGRSVSRLAGRFLCPWASPRGLRLMLLGGVSAASLGRPDLHCALARDPLPIC